MIFSVYEQQPIFVLSDGRLCPSVVFGRRLWSMAGFFTHCLAIVMKD